MHTPSVLWLFGLPSAGKTTLACALRDRFLVQDRRVFMLDGDEIRKGLCSDLGFSDKDRSENLRRAAEVARLLVSQGNLVICAFVTPKEHHRTLVRQILGSMVQFVFVHCPVEVCISRDVKGLYAQAVSNALAGMTGIQDTFESTTKDVLTVRTDKESVEQCLDAIATVLK